MESPVVPIALEISDSLRLDDGDIERLRKSTEDHFVERKSFGDWRKDSVKTLVAFANSLPIGRPGFFFIGVKDNGEVEAREHNLDQIQRTLAAQLQPVYPRLTYTVKGLREGERNYLVVIIHGSAQRPHFSGPSFVREGSQTKEASDAQYRALIAERSSRVYEMRKWIGREVSYAILGGNTLTMGLVDCNEFFFTFREASGRVASLPIERVQLSHDHDANRLKLVVTDPR
jgi:hypothetical protein